MAVSFDRRTFARAFGAGATALASPSLRSSAARAQPAQPRCLVFFFRANGVITNTWWPAGGETSFTLGPGSAPLEPWRKHLLFLRGIHQNTFKLGPGDQHQMGVGQLLTARPLLPGPFRGNGMNPPAGWASGISIDQAVAKHLGVQSLDLGVVTTGGSVIARMSYSDGDRPRAPIDNPYTAFDQVFGRFTVPTGPSGAAQLERIRARKQSVIDYVNGDLRALAARLPAADRPRLDAHVAGIRALELGLAKLSAGAPPACAVPMKAAAGLAYRDPRNMQAVAALQMDILVKALACGVTRVASLMWSTGVSFVPYTWLGVSEAHHELSHAGPGDTTSRAKLTKIDAFLAGQYADLLRRMDEAGLLASSAAIMVNDLGDGASHTGNNIPFVIGGSAGGQFRTGRYLQFPGRSHNDLWVSVANAMGLQTTTFGEPSLCTGPLAGLG
jgi:hypothetical protein